MKKIAILGSTGSIGRNTVEIIRRFPGFYRAVALAAGENTELLAEQIRLLKPGLAAVRTEALAFDLKKRLGGIPVEILYGEEGYLACAAYSEADILVSAIVGAAGLLPTLAGLRAGKTIALANKESLVMAGDLLIPLAHKKNLRILPVDSEHSAIFQCLAGQREKDVTSLILTASGGPFLHYPKKDFAKIRPKDALAHPTWEMGKKISIDSATLMNKGLEVIEAMHLFNMPPEKIRVVVHPQSIIHSMVAFRDGAVLAQMGIPDMKGAIALALSWPERLPLEAPLPDFSSLDLHLEKPDFERFPSLKIAFEVAEARGILPAVMNAANEVAVEAFLNGRLSFDKMPGLVSEVLLRTENRKVPDVETLLDADQKARFLAGKLLKERFSQNHRAL